MSAEREIARAAQAVHQRLHQHQSEQAGHRLQYAIVRQMHGTTIMQAELVEGQHLLDDDDLVESAWIRKFIVDVGLNVGDTVVVHLMSDGQWLVTDAL